MLEARNENPDVEIKIKNRNMTHFVIIKPYKDSVFLFFLIFNRESVEMMGVDRMG